uniref:NIPA-like domain containing 3 n=1 Tax=Iconisemion striatum TaxID=60296 RepID=A0A1A7XWG1_9TELE
MDMVNGIPTIHDKGLVVQPDYNGAFSYGTLVNNDGVAAATLPANLEYPTLQPDVERFRGDGLASGIQNDYESLPPSRSKNSFQVDSERRNDLILMIDTGSEVRPKHQQCSLLVVYTDVF